ncbi:MAG: hypothetical protein ACYC7A_19375 [Thermoanaerobaculia bacterium]
MKIVRVEYEQERDCFTPVDVFTHTEVEALGYIPIAAVKPHLLTNGLEIWLFEASTDDMPRRTKWLSELRAGCAFCLAPVEFHTGEPHFLGQDEVSGHAVCREFRN